MEYRGVGNRVAVQLEQLKLQIPREEILAILDLKGFKIVDVNVLALARRCMGVSEYRRGARLCEAPRVFNCSSFVKWLYGERGIWLPRRSIQQRELGERVELTQLVAGDVIFVSGRIDYYSDDPADGVGHVGLVTGEGTVIHAANRKVGVVESPLNDFIRSGFRGARRYIPQGMEVLTLEVPAGREVEIADDIRWIVLQSLGRKKC